MSAKAAAYWATTLLFAAFMAYNAYAYLSRDPKMMTAMFSLGYPPYFPIILGIAKILGVIAILVPSAPRTKEWAYAGFTFTMIGAFFSHLASGQVREAAMPVALLIVMAASYLLRPPMRRILEAAAAVR
jgi:putative oxidoreductase